MTTPLQHNLSDPEYQLLNAVCESTPQALALCQAMKESGWDTSEQEAYLKQQLQTAQNAKARFFPNRP